MLSQPTILITGSAERSGRAIALAAEIWRSSTQGWPMSLWQATVLREN